MKQDREREMDNNSKIQTKYIQRHREIGVEISK